MSEAATAERVSAPPASSTRPSIVLDGRRIGAYEVRYELASGGMATVYLARAPGIGGMPPRAVALKCIHPHLARQADIVAMFVDEARIAARIQHPHVCSVLDFGEADGVPFIAMEFLRGASLATLMRGLGPGGGGGPGARLPVQSLVARVVRVIGDACEGLHAAHELRADDGTPLEVVHRDVTPGNLFLGADGLVRVVDFGIARAEGRLHRTATGQLKGTLAYMAPEYVSDEHLDRRADVWSVGVVAWELLTGQRMFRRETELETLRAVAHDPIVPPSRVRPGIPPAVDAAILRALAREREHRWPTARELGRALHRASSASGAAHAADLAEWLEQLFPERRAEQDELVRATLGSRAVAAGMAYGESEGPSAERVTAPAIPRPSARPPRVADEGSASSAPAAPPPPLAGAAPSPDRSRGVGRSIAALVVGIAIGAVSLGASRWSGESAARRAELDAPPGAPSPDLAADPARAVPEAIAPRSDVAADTPSEAVAAPDPGDRGEIEAGAEGDEEAPPRAARPAGRGFANVSSRGGWADIYHRGRFVGRTPLRLDLPAGRQVLQLRPLGRGPERRLVVWVPADGDTSASISVQ